MSPGRSASRVLLVIGTGVAVVCAIQCVRSFRAAQLSESGTAEGLLGATRLEPHNAEYWRRLGLFRLYQYGDPPGALDAFHRATELDPRDADSWIGTAYSQQLLGSADAERDALVRAITAEPKRLEIAWQAANLYAVLGDREAMLRELCITITHDARRSDAARDLARRYGAGINAVSHECDSEETKR